MAGLSPKVLVATHGHCFDGLASAALFTHLLSALEGAGLRFSYLACGYGHAQRRPEAALAGADISAILDYRYSPSERLTWFFDHHPTAFESVDARRDYERRLDSGVDQRLFYDPGAGSCSRLIADVATQRFGLDLTHLEPLIEWADRVDTAAFESPEQAVDPSSPIMQLVGVVEHYGDDRMLKRLVPRLLAEPLNEVATSPDIQRLHAPIASRHQDFRARVKHRAERRGRVVLVDLTDKPLEVIGKFVTYALFPDSTYSVVVGLLKTGVKISVGYNPWSGRRLDTDISKICARFGGGGHPVVGGIAFSPKEVERARAVARAIAEELA
ncbi:MAG: hypothetical protein KC766_22280 [Myxococcales bacterium]|nr:hypothetical protein [Myxococcales bacterium]